jgi:hypothetical protein
MNSYKGFDQTATIVQRRERVDGIRLVTVAAIATPTSAHLWVRALRGDLLARDELFARIMPQDTLPYEA